MFAIVLAAWASSGASRWAAVGAGLVLLGGAVLALSLLNLGSALTPNPVPNGSDLRRDGMYRRVRHPIYTGLLLVMLGVVLLRPGWWPLVFWVLLLGILTAKAQWEERMLSRLFPEYPDYMRMTGRFLPKLRRSR